MRCDISPALLLSQKWLLCRYHQQNQRWHHHGLHTSCWTPIRRAQNSKKWGCKKGAPQNGGLKPPASRVISRNGRVVSRHVRELHVWFVVVRIGTDAVVRNEKKGLYTHEKFVHPWTCFVSVGLSSRKRACRRTVHAMTSEGAELAEWEGVRCDLSEYRKVLRINSRRTVRTMQIRVEER